GFSVTMPGKFAAFSLASEITDRARLMGSANTLVRIEGGWRADNTDTEGVEGALTSCFAVLMTCGCVILQSRNKGHCSLALAEPHAQLCGRWRSVVLRTLIS